MAWMRRKYSLELVCDLGYVKHNASILTDLKLCFGTIKYKLGRQSQTCLIRRERELKGVWSGTIYN
jgi:hypothetical protein